MSEPAKNETAPPTTESILSRMDSDPVFRSAVAELFAEVQRKAAAPATPMVRLAPPTKKVQHAVQFRSGVCPCCESDAKPIQPGETRKIGVLPQVLFRGEKAIADPGIDYDAFVIENVYVGIKPQYRASRPARDLFVAVRRPADLPEDDWQRGKQGVVFDTAQCGLWIVMEVKNVTDRPLPFSMTIAGSAVF